MTRGEAKTQLKDVLHMLMDSDSVYDVEKYEDRIDISVDEFLSHDGGALESPRRLWNALRHYVPELYEELPNELTPRHPGYGYAALIAICGIIGVRTWET